MIAKSNGELIYVNKIETMFFVIKESKDAIFSVEFRPDVLELIRQPRYIGWFSGIDLCRRNFEVTINAKCNKNSDIRDFVKFQNYSLKMDAKTNQILFQCFWELGLL